MEVDESILKVICKTSFDKLTEKRGFGVHLPSEKEFDKVIINENNNIRTEEESNLLSIIYGLQQALNVAKQYPTKYKQINIYTGVGGFYTIYQYQFKK